MEIFLLTYLCVNIAFRARIRGLKPLPWILRTLLAAFISSIIAMIFIVISWMRQYGSSQKDMENMQAMMKSGELTLSNWNLLFVMVCMFGGYLFVRYRIEKYPKLKNNEQDDLPPQ